MLMWEDNMGWTFSLEEVVLWIMYHILVWRNNLMLKTS